MSDYERRMELEKHLKNRINFYKTLDHAFTHESTSVTAEQLMDEVEELTALDVECGHIAADGLLSAILRMRGLSELADRFDKLTKWYS